MYDIFYTEKKEEQMNLLTNCDLPILDVMTRIYKKNGVWIQTTRKYKERKTK